MKNKRIIIIFVVCISMSLTTSAQKKVDKKSNEDMTSWKYEMECAGTGIQGTYLVKVWTVSKNRSKAIEQCTKCAVHGVIFKGFSDHSGKCTGQKPLSNSPSLESEKKDFFDRFFAEDGDYLKYVHNTDAVEVFKIKEGFKVGSIVSVSKDLLRSDLEKAGILKNLGSGF